MEQEIKAIIEKNLPAQVGDFLKERLIQAEEDAAKVKELQRILDTRAAAIRDLEKQIAYYKKLDERNNTLEAREKIVSDKERNLEIETLKFQLASEKEKSIFSKDVALGLVRNIEYRRSLFDSKNKPYIDQYGHTQYQNTSQNSDEKKVAE